MFQLCRVLSLQRFYLALLLLYDIIQSLDGRQGYAIGIYCADVSIILAQTESRVEILSDWSICRTDGF